MAPSIAARRATREHDSDHQHVSLSFHDVDVFKTAALPPLSDLDHHPDILSSAYFPHKVLQIDSWEPSLHGFASTLASPLSPSPVTSPSLAGTPNTSHCYASFSPTDSPLASPSCDSNPRLKRKMVKKRPSLSSILIPSLKQYPTTSPTAFSPKSASRARSQSDASALPLIPDLPNQESPPPDFLLDDDPFANHTAGRGAAPRPHATSVESTTTPMRPARKPRSPLASDSKAAATRPHTSPSPSSSSFASTSTAGLMASASVHHRRPAHTRPAFAPRPSLPSLRTLQSSEFVYPIKARKGTLGARLPLEPWDMPADSTSPVFASHDIRPESNSAASVTADSEHQHDVDGAQSSENMGAQHVSRPTDAGWIPRGLSHVAASDDESASMAFAQSPISLEDALDGHLKNPDSTGTGVLSFYDILSTLSPYHSSSFPTSPTSTFSPSYLSSPESQPRSSIALSRHSSDSERSASSSAISSSDENALFELDDFTTQSRSSSHSPEPEMGRDVDFSTALEQSPSQEDFQPGTSASTIRGPILSSPDKTEPPASNEEGEDWRTSFAEEFEYYEATNDDSGSESGINDEPVDSDRYGDQHTSSGGRHREDRQSGGGGSRDWKGQGDRGASGGGYGGSGGGGASGGGRGGGDDRRDDDRIPPSKSSFSTPSEKEESEGEEDEDATRRARAPAARPKAPETPPADSENTDDDDIPLAQRIPTALRAQRTIRRQVRDENDERRRQRALKRQEQYKASSSQEQHVAPRSTSIPASRGATDIPRDSSGPISSTHAAPVFSPHASGSSSQPILRPRTKTLPSNTARPFAVEDLTKRLQNVQTGSPVASSTRRYHSSADHQPSNPDELGRRSTEDSHTQQSMPDRGVRAARSFHRSNVPDAAPPPPGPLPTRHLGRSATSVTRPRPRPSLEAPAELPPRVQTTEGAPSHRSRSVRRPHDDGRPATSSGYPEPRPPMPLASQPEATFAVTSRDVKPQVAWQQRVFIADMQRFNMLEIDPTTTAREVIHMLEKQKVLEGWAGIGGWMLYEVSQDFGMERPIRGFELVSDIINSWDKDKTVNMLLVKKTSLATLLHPSAIPTSSPRCSGYVEWESKRGKWNKRWLELREHGLWLSKKDNGKDETFLCSLANFDAYQVTRLHKSPKPFVFAVKSTDNLTFFENASDYVHIFCCPEKDGQRWLEGILLARSYVINQERNVISNSSVAPTPSTGVGRLLSRSGTRKGARTAQPLVNVSAPASVAAVTNPAHVFEPGSLLAQR